MERSLAEGVSVVVPVFRSTDSLVELRRRVGEALADIPHELILVDDGSPVDTWRVLVGLAEDPAVVAIRLGRNAGQHAALLAGVRAARRRVVVTVDDDLQNPPEEIPRLLAELRDGVDVVYGWTPETAHAWWRRAGSGAVRAVVATALESPSARHMGAFRAFRTDLRDGFAGDLGPSISLDALLSWSTDRFGLVEVAHHARREGRSGYSFRRLARFAIDTVTGYSIRPLRWVTTLGLASAVFGVGVLAYVIGRFLLQGSQVAGFPFLASVIAIFAGAQMISLGVIGEYLGRTHVRVQRRPTYVIAERIDRRPAAGDAA